MKIAVHIEILAGKTSRHVKMNLVGLLTEWRKGWLINAINTVYYLQRVVLVLTIYWFNFPFNFYPGLHMSYQYKSDGIFILGNINKQTCVSVPNIQKRKLKS